MVSLFLQCRLDSTRLPNKALLKLENIEVISHAMRALKQVKADNYVLLTTEDSISKLESLALNEGFSTFVGSKNDVLLRFIKAAEKFNSKTIIRATGDNPLVSSSLANKILKLHLEEKADYSGFLKMPIGTGVEILSVEALKKALIESNEKFDHEHVAPYLYNNPDKFKINRVDSEKKLHIENCRVTLDTKDDFDNLKTIFKALYNSKPIEIEQLVDYLNGK